MKHDETRDDGTRNAETTRRRLTLVLGASALVGGLGCATQLVSEMPNSHITKFVEGEVVLTDTILALGLLDPEPGESAGKTRGVAFLGKKQTYILTTGGDKLLKLAQQLDNDRLVLQSDSRLLRLRDQQVWGMVQLRYTLLADDAPAAQIEQEKALLNRLGFRGPRDDSRSIEFYVQGVVRPALQLPASMPALRRTPEIVFRAPPTIESTPNLSKAALLPLAVTVDLLASPLYIAGLTVIGIGKIVNH